MAFADILHEAMITYLSRNPVGIAAMKSVPINVEGDYTIYSLDQARTTKIEDLLKDRTVLKSLKIDVFEHKIPLLPLGFKQFIFLKKLF